MSGSLDFADMIVNGVTVEEATAHIIPMASVWIRIKNDSVFWPKLCEDEKVEITHKDTTYYGTIRAFKCCQNRFCADGVSTQVRIWLK